MVLMVKKVGLLLAGFLMLFVFASQVEANEGVVVLRPEAGYEGECYAASVFIDGSYKVLATCRNLPTALGAENNRLLLWREDDTGKMARVGELTRGKLQASVNSKFVRLFVTSEAEGSPKLPEGPILAQGNLTAINFDEKVVGQPSLTLAPTGVAPTKTAGQVVDVDDTGEGSRIGNIFSGIAKAVGLGFVLLLVVVGVLGFLARRKGL